MTCECIDRVVIDVTDRQQAFIDEYLIDMNATQAYKRAGYKCKNDKVAEVSSCQLLRNPIISRAIEEKLQERSARTEITADYVLTGLQEVAERCLQKKPVMVFDKVDKCMKQATQEVEDETGQVVEASVWTFDSTGANRAFELIGKHLQLFTDKLKVDGSMAVTFAGENVLEDESTS